MSDSQPTSDPDAPCSPDLQCRDSQADHDALVRIHSLASSYKTPGFMALNSPHSTLQPSTQNQIPVPDGLSDLDQEYNDIQRMPSNTSTSAQSRRLGRKASDSRQPQSTLRPNESRELPTEATPLLHNLNETESGEGTDPGHAGRKTYKEAVGGDGPLSTTWTKETKILGKYSRSLILTFVLQYMLPVTSVFTVGHLGKVELGAVSLGSMTANITGYAVYQGLATSLDTLCAQAYGSGRKELVGIHFQRMCCFLTLVSLPIAAVWLNGSRIINAIVPERETADLAGLYLKVLTAGIIPYAIFESSKRFVQAQGLFSANLYALLIVTPLNIFLHWFLVWHLGWGFVGAPIALVIAESTLPLMMFLYVILIDGKQCWGGFTRECFQNWMPMIKLSLPGLVALEAEYAAFEILTFASAWLGPVELATQSLLSTIAAMTFQIPFPISIAASTRVAHLIGAGLASEAKLSARVALIASVFVGALNMILLSALRYQIPKLFTNDSEVLETAATVLPLISTFQLFDAVAANCNGILRGLGRQSVGGYVALFAYYIVALPISFGSGFGLNWGLIGLWCGPATALFLVSVIESAFIFLTSWNRAVEDARARNEST